MPGINTQTDPLTGVDYLPSRSTVPTIGFLPTTGSSSASGGGSSNGNSGGVSDLVGLGVSLLPALFGNNQPKADATATTKELKTLGESTTASGKATQAQGTEALAPVIAYLKALTSGSPADLLNATAPERGRVLDQYDTAKKSASFLPRGGGQASALLNLEADKAKTLTQQTFDARTKGVDQASQLGATLSAQGASQQATGAQELAQVLNAQNEQAQEEAKSQAGLGSTIGKIATAALGFFL